MVLAEPDAEALKAHKRHNVPLLFLTELWVPARNRRQGAAHALVLAATEWADAARVDLWLYTAPHGRGDRPDHAQLAAFYKQYGFKRAPAYSAECEMVRRHVRRS